MYRIGIDVGSTYTKYCIMKDNTIESLFMEKTPIRQKNYFERKLHSLTTIYPDAEIISCGYGKKNVDRLKNMNELTALARGCYFVTGNSGIVLDVGGQDTKIIRQEEGRLKEFFINDKCAAGSGMFLTNTLDMLGMKFQDIDLSCTSGSHVKLSSICAVFAQSEIVEMIADNRTETEILQAVIEHIFTKSKQILVKVQSAPILISGGLCQIRGIRSFAEKILERRCRVVKNGEYLSAIGCAIL